MSSFNETDAIEGECPVDEELEAMTILEINNKRLREDVDNLEGLLHSEVLHQLRVRSDLEEINKALGNIQCKLIASNKGKVRLEEEIERLEKQLWKEKKISAVLEAKLLKSEKDNAALVVELKNEKELYLKLQDDLPVKFVRFAGESNEKPQNVIPVSGSRYADDVRMRP